MWGKKTGTKKPAKKVLIVEDDALLSKVLAAGLQTEKFQVTVAENGLQVTGLAKTFKPDIILLDLILPGLDGFAVLKQLKAESATQNIPVVVISNLSDIGDVKSTKALGAEEFFIKSNTEMAQIIKYVKEKLEI